MTKISAKLLLEDAIKNDYAVASFAVSNMEQIHGIVDAAGKCNAPLILMLSNKSLKYSAYLPYIIDAAIKESPEIPIAMHLDHATSFEMCKKAIDFGFSSVMIDGTFTEDGKPSSFEYNLNITKKVVDYARQFGVTVEGELGSIGGKEEDLEAAKEKYTDPLLATEFVDFTGVDALAISIGNSHGLNKFEGEQRLRFDILHQINNNIPEVPLVLHGASSLPDKYARIISEYGGTLKEVKGVPMDQIIQATKLGVKKINIYTDLTLCMMAAVRKYIFTNPAEIDPRKYLGSCREDIMELVSEKMKQFGLVNRAAGLVS